MIIARAPMRITFVGGGTDLKSFFQHESGAVVNAAINKYVYVTVNRKFDPGLRVKYSKTENVGTIDQIEHPLFREALRLVGITNHIEVTSHADIPSRGSGLGSSSSFLVCLLHALYAYQGKLKSPEDLARAAVHIERDILGEHGGFQDQYIAAYGGLRYMEFHDPGHVHVSHILCSEPTWRALQDKLMLFYTGITRKSHAVQAQAVANTSVNMERLRSIKWQAARMRDELQKGNPDAVGQMLHDYWQSKRLLAQGVSSDEIDSQYAKAIAAGAAGGKILGAGGGGFLLFYVPEDRQDAVKVALDPLKHVPFKLEREGSKVIYVAENFLPMEGTDA
jgi:D-glycero-alpha-D-manno-heptose-7-phosphate kinase